MDHTNQPRCQTLTTAKTRASSGRNNTCLIHIKNNSLVDIETWLRNGQNDSSNNQHFFDCVCYRAPCLRLGSSCHPCTGPVHGEDRHERAAIAQRSRARQALSQSHSPLKRYFFFIHSYPQTQHTHFFHSHSSDNYFQWYRGIRSFFRQPLI